MATPSGDSVAPNGRSRGGHNKDSATSGTQGEKTAVDAGRPSGRLAAMRKEWPLLMSPINALFPPAAPEGSLPLIAAAPNRAAWRARKGLFRAMIVTLACYILLVEPASLQLLGNAAFFGLIVSVMIPPTFPPLVFLLVAVMLVMGMFVGWAWGCATMAAGLRARDQVLLASQVQTTQKSIASSTNPSAAYRQQIFEGAFLYTPTTVVVGCMFAVGNFALGYLRATNAKLTLVAIFGSIVNDVFGSYSPLFPIPQYTLAYTFLLPTACFIACAVAANILIFPQTLNHSWTTDLVDSFLIPVLQRSQIHSKLLSTTPPTREHGDEAWSSIGPQLDGTQAKMSGALEGLLGGLGLAKLEIARGRLGASDLASLVDKLNELMSRSMGLGVLYRTVSRQHRRKFGEGKQDSSSSNPSSIADEKPDKLKLGTTRMRRMQHRVEEAERQHDHHLGALLPLLAEASAPLRTASDEALLGAMEWLTQINHSRWKRQPTPEGVAQHLSEQQARISALDQQLAEFRTTRRLEICAPFKRFFDPQTGTLLRESRPSPASLYVVLAASDNLTNYCETVLTFVQHIYALEDKRRVNKFWGPIGISKIGRLLKGGKHGGAEILGDGSDPDAITLVDDDDSDSQDDDDTATRTDDAKPDKDKKGRKAKSSEEDGFFASRKFERHDPDARPPKNASQRLGVRIAAFGSWLGKAETIFALKYCAGSILLWLPQVFPSSAYFSYVNKSLWALIMFQTGLAVYAGDQLLQTVQKMAGTAIGLVLGMAIWYAGAGNGSGNAIGLGALVFVLMTPIVAFRLFAPPSQAQLAILAAVTTVLIVGYSWLDAPGHLPTLGNPGIGANLAWKRALLVLIGTAAAIIMMILPPRMSSRAFVRRTLATCIDSTGRVYSGIISAWLSEESAENDSSVWTESTKKQARARMLAIHSTLSNCKVSIVQSSYEVSLRGDWPKDQYLRLLAAQLTIIQSLAQLGLSLTKLDRRWRQALVRQTAFLNPNLISDVSSTFYLLSMALRQGSPLPQPTPGPLLDRLLYHDLRMRKLTDEDPEHDHDHVEGASTGAHQLTWDILGDPEYARYASAMLALANILSALDETEEIVKDLVGVVSMPGYAGLQQTPAEV